MRRRVLAASAAAFMAAWPHLADASGDFGCTPDWTLEASSYDCAGSAMISPRNDTRINLFWLLRDGAGLSTPGPLAYPAADWENASYGHVFLSWDTLQAAFWPRPDTAGEDGYGDEANSAGSRCQTLASGDKAFRSALAASKGLKPGEGDTLSQARDLVKPACDGDKGSASWPSGVSSTTAMAFLAYLQGARAFYAEDFAAARARFAELSKVRDPWLAETARYMTARNELAAAQAGAIDEWGAYSADKADKAAAQRGRTALSDYLSAYPRGRYAASATGLQRRAVWLLGDGPALAHSYAGMLARQHLSGPETPQLMQEVESKLFFGTGLGGNADAPMLLATWDLLRMRQTDPELAEYVPKPLSAQELEAQAPVFAGMPDLFGYLQASHAFHVAHDYRRVLSLIPDDARRQAYTPLAYSRQMLRGLALERLGDDNAAGFWRQLVGGVKDLYQRPAAELAFAMDRERHGALVQVFGLDSPVAEPEIRARLLTQVAGPDLLRTQSGQAAKSRLEREVALFTLLYKELSRGRYDAFGRDIRLVPANAGVEGWIGGWPDDSERKVPLGLFGKGRWNDGYPCPALTQTAATLAVRPNDVKARLCLGEFYRLNGFDGYLADENKPAVDQLGGTPDLFPGAPVNRGALYAAVLVDRSAAPDDVAYALYRSVMCYAPSGNNECGKDEAPQAQRKAWFQRLKQGYPKSKWAIELKYYW